MKMSLSKRVNYLLKMSPPPTWTEWITQRCEDESKAINFVSRRRPARPAWLRQPRQTRCPSRAAADRTSVPERDCKYDGMTVGCMCHLSINCHIVFKSGYVDRSKPGANLHLRTRFDLSTAGERVDMLSHEKMRYCLFDIFR